MRIVKVGTKDPVKLEAINDVFERYYGKSEVIVRGYDVDLNAIIQPIGDEIFRGAENFLETLKRKCAGGYDFLVASESGIIQLYGKAFSIQVVIIEDKNGKKGFGLSQGYEIPEQYVKKAMAFSVKNVMNRVFKGRGGIKFLTQNQLTEEDLVRNATIMALTRLINGLNW